MRVYHVKKGVHGGSYEIVLTTEVRVQRAKREARAEIEIPLR